MRAMRFWSALSTKVSVSSWRLRLVALEVRMWRFIEWPRLILPVAVFLKRFAAPLWVFIFGITSFYYNINAPTPPAAHRKMSLDAGLSITAVLLGPPEYWRFLDLGAGNRFTPGHAQRSLQQVLQQFFFRRCNVLGELLRPLRY